MHKIKNEGGGIFGGRLEKLNGKVQGKEKRRKIESQREELKKNCGAKRILGGPR